MNTIIYTDAQGETQTCTVAKDRAYTMAMMRNILHNGGTIVSLNGLAA